MNHRPRLAGRVLRGFAVLVVVDVDAVVDVDNRLGGEQG